MKRTLMATGAALLLAVASFTIPSDASAQNRAGASRGPSISGGAPRMSGGPSHFSGGPSRFSGPRNFSVNRGNNFRFNRGFARRRFGPAVGFAFASPYFYDGYYDDCWEWRRVHTRFGWRTVRVNVCY